MKVKILRVLYLDLSGELKELNISIRRHNIYNDSLISCPEYMPMPDFIRQINSPHFIAIHHFNGLRHTHFSKSAFLSHIFNITK